MKKILLLSQLFLMTVTISFAQQSITLEDIWQRYTYYPSYIPGFNFEQDGQHYTRQVDNAVVQYDLLTGYKTSTYLTADKLKGRNRFGGQMDSYEFSADEDKIMIASETEQIYRHSSRSNFFVWDRAEIVPVFEQGKVMYATFNPQADKVAFVYENNLYVRNIKTREVTKVTQDGQMNKIINGATDWVYEEEFAFWRGFQWSPDGNKIAYYRFDESEVPEFTMTNYHDDMYPEYVTFKYPKVGEKNAKVDIFIYNLDNQEIVKVDITDDTNGAKDYYIPRIKWTQNNNELVVFKMNRHQNDLKLLLADATTGKTKVLLEEKNKYYIDIHDNLTFLRNGKQFVWTSEKDGFNHVYLYNMNGSLDRQLTKGDWEVTEFYGVDEKNEKFYYQAGKETAVQREVYEGNLSGKKSKKLTTKKGWNSANFSSTYDYYVLTYSSANTAPVFEVYQRDGKLVRVIEDNKRIGSLQEKYNTQPVQFSTIKTSEDVTLNTWTIMPPNFDKSRKYPVFMYLYGGPGSQQATDSWNGQNYWWFQMLAQQGYIVTCVDNRGTGGRGQEFKKITYQQLGHYETIDQIEAAKYYASLPYTDKNRIGIFGWSYGGYMSSLAILKGNDVFKAAIAVAPVTNWKWYDSIYTERYMRTLKENEKGYAENSPVYFADRLKGNYLLVHGIGDDNVHFQHAAEMANALIKVNKQYDTYFYPNRNHGIYGGLTRLHLYTKMTNFLKDKLMNDTTEVGK